MQLSGNAILLHARPHGESALILTLFSADHGRFRALLKGGRKKRAELQAGNVGHFSWTRRLDHQLGSLRWETTASPVAPYLHKPKALAALQYLAEILYVSLPEEQAYPALYVRTLSLLARLGDEALPAHLAFWELQLLTTLGYGLSLTKEEAVPCAEDSPLTYVSPNTGRAVSAVTGAPYKTKLLPLPHLFGGPAQDEGADLLAAFRLTGFFLEQAVQGKSLESRSYMLTQFEKERVR